MTAAPTLPRQPGDPSPSQDVERMLRVDHAGEYGAVRIYEGQLAVLGRSSSSKTIRHMADQEREHLATFNKMIGDRKVRPTALLPVWHVAGFALGAASALLGEKAAMACTVAVEEVIDEHYAAQIARLDEHEGELRQTFAKFRQEEIEHRDIALDHDAKKSPVFDPLTQVVKAGSKLAIWLSERV